MTSDEVDSVEFHFPGLQYCGPGTDLKKRLKSDGKTPKVRFAPVDRVDEISLEHDLFYKDHKNVWDRYEADFKMIRQLHGIKNPGIRERIKKCIVIPILWLKCLLVRLFCHRRRI